MLCSYTVFTLNNYQIVKYSPELEVKTFVVKKRAKSL